MPGPRFVSEYETASWPGGANPRTASVTCAAGDLLVVVAATEGDTLTLGTPTGGTGTVYTLKASVVVASHCAGYCWTVPVVTTESFTMSITSAPGAGRFGFNVFRFAGRPSPGAVNSSGSGGAGSTASLSLTTTQRNAAIAMIVADWSAGTGARTYNTTAGAFTEQTYANEAGFYTVYAGYYADVGAVGSKTVGLTAPTMTPTMIALEVKGVPDVAVFVGQAVKRAAEW